MDKDMQHTLLVLLKKHRNTFSELKALYKRLRKGLDNLDSGEISKCQDNEKLLTGRLAGEREELKPLIEQWKKLERRGREKILQGALGKEIDAIEQIALEMSNSYERLFDKGTGTARSAAGHSKTGSLSDMIHLYR